MSKFIKHPTAKVVLDTRFKKANGKYPVRLRVTYLRVQKYFGLDIELNEEEYTNCLSNRPRKELKEIAQKVSKAEVDANEVIKKMVEFNFEKFEAAYFKGISTDKMKVYELFEEYITKLKNKGRIGTAISYGNALNSFKAYKRDLKF
ncbi:MAG: site-specific integrase, partial [Cytophagales bacterium]|nr:site-specific integrase [Cytophagales bacterium]